jgi:hypothetical protein
MSCGKTCVIKHALAVPIVDKKKKHAKVRQTRRADCKGVLSSKNKKHTPHT